MPPEARPNTLRELDQRNEKEEVSISNPNLLKPHIKPTCLLSIGRKSGEVEPLLDSHWMFFFEEECWGLENLWKDLKAPYERIVT